MGSEYDKDKTGTDIDTAPQVIHNINNLRKLVIEMVKCISRGMESGIYRWMEHRNPHYANGYFLTRILYIFNFKLF